MRDVIASMSDPLTHPGLFVIVKGDSLEYLCVIRMINAEAMCKAKCKQQVYEERPTTFNAEKL